MEAFILSFPPEPDRHNLPVLIIFSFLHIYNSYINIPYKNYYNTIAKNRKVCYPLFRPSGVNTYLHLTYYNYIQYVIKPKILYKLNSILELEYVNILHIEYI